MSTSSEAVAKTIESALKAVQAADLPENLVAPAFEWALSALGGQSQIVPPGNDDHQTDEPNGVVAKVANGLSVEASELAQILHVDDDDLPQFDVPPSRLPSKTSDGARRIAVLTVAARKLALGENWTKLETLRAAAEQSGVYDSGNFSTHMKGTSDWLRIKGTGNNREFQIRPTAVSQAADWVREFAGG